MKINILQNDFGSLCICALRYCHGRKSYMPGLIQGIVSAHFDDLSEKDLSIIAEDKDYQERFNLWGNDIDKESWLMFYSKLDQFAKESRKDNER